MKSQPFLTIGIISIRILLLVSIFTSVECNAQPAKGRWLLALSKSDYTLAVVDPVTLKVITRIPVSADPHEVIASSDGKMAIVTSYGGGSFHALDIIDLVAQKPLRTIDTRPLYGPHGLVYVNGKAWFSAEGSKAVGRYDPATNQLDWSMGTGQDRSHMIYVTPDEKTIYTTNMGSGTISILESPQVSTGSASSMAAQHKEWKQTIVPVSRGSEGFDLSPDGSELWTASGEDGMIFIMTTSEKKLAARLDAKVFGANRLKFTPNGRLVFISSLRTGEITIFDSEARKEIKRLKISKGATGILMDPDGSRVFVSCSADNFVAVIDLSTLEVTSKFDVGKNPDGLAWAEMK